VTTNQKGAIAETAIVHAATKRGVAVLKPVSDERYDLVFDFRPRLVRVQCKWVARKESVIIVRSYSSRRNADGFLKSFYKRDEVDAIAAYCAELDRCYFLPLERFRGHSGIRLRLEAARNNQRVNINWAQDFDFERLDWSALGAVAQLGER